MAKGKKLPKTRGPYARKQLDGSPVRWWGDFRHLGGKREPLCAKGERVATTEQNLAVKLYGIRLEEIAAGVASLPSKRAGSTGKVIAEYLEHRRSHSKATANWLVQTETFLGRAVAYFGADRPLRAITADDVARWVVYMRTQESGRNGTFSEETIRKHIHALSGLFRRAQRSGHVPAGHNPVALLEADERPAREASPDVWLEVHEAARLLEAARTYRAPANEPLMCLAYPLLATFLLTGGRADEVFGLDLNDLQFDRKLVAFRPNQWRRGKQGKTAKANRVVPMFPQLEAILHEYITGARLEIILRHGLDLTLLFPSPDSGKRIGDLRKVIDRLCARAGLPVGRYRATAFRKTFASARLQTLDNGAPIAQRTVQAEMGHESGAMLEQVYGRLGTVRHRSDVVEYRVAGSAESSATLPTGTNRTPSPKSVGVAG